jgi:xanthine dehydrogenase accessory factor
LRWASSSRRTGLSGGTLDLAALNAERQARRAAVLVSDLAGGTQRLVKQVAIAADPLAELLERQLRSGKSGMVEADGTSCS